MNFVDISEDECQELFAGVSKYMKVNCSASTVPMYPEPGSQTSPYGPTGSWYPIVEAPRAGSQIAHVTNRHIGMDSIETPDSRKAFGDFIENVVGSAKTKSDVDHTYLIILLHFGFAHSSDAALRHFDETSLNPALKESFANVMWERMLDLPYGKRMPEDQAQAYAHDRQAVTEKFANYFEKTAPANLNIDGYDEPDWKERYWGGKTYDFC